MSHDIRTPMNAIVGITDLMAHEPGNSDRMRSYIEKVQMSSRHLLSLINDILDMSKIESNEVALNQDAICLADQVDQVDNIIRPRSGARPSPSAPTPSPMNISWATVSVCGRCS